MLLDIKNEIQTSTFDFTDKAIGFEIRRFQFLSTWLQIP